MATGAAGGANHELGLRYRDILARSGVRLRLVNTTGSLDNLARLRDRRSGVQVGFMQGGTTTRKESPNVESLGTVFFEPLWLFSRSGIGHDIQAFRGRRVSIGPEGSGGRAFALEVLKRTKVEDGVGALLGFPPQEAADKLIAGEIDIAFIVSGWDSPVVRRLMATDGIEVVSAVRPDAFIALYPFLSKVVLPAGVADLAANRPPADVILLSPKASLAIRDDLHPAIPVSSAQRRRADPLSAGNIPEGRPVSCCGVRRSAAQRGSPALLQERPARSSGLSPVLAGGSVRKISGCVCSGARSALSGDQVTAAGLRLADAVQDSAPL
jgi:hypothetical protein